MDLTALNEMGLTSGEVKVYLALLRLGSSKTGLLASKAGVSSSKVYKILDRLEKKGLVGHVLKGKVKNFNALQPARLLDYLDEEEERLGRSREMVEKMLPQLEKERVSAGSRSEATVYDGLKAVTNFFRNMIDELNPGDEYHVIGAGYGDVAPGLRAFFQAHHLRRSKKRIKLKMLANFDVKGKLETNTRFHSEIRYLPQYLITNMEIVLYRDKAFIAIFTRDPKGFLIESEEAVRSFEAYFRALWKIAKP
jgi:sugar-specific transcriptional regulator TrmB